MLIAFDKFFFEKGIKNMLKNLLKTDGWDWNKINLEGWEV